MQIANNVLRLREAELTLSSYSKELVAQHYGGIPRLKPANYFGDDYRDIVKQYRLSQQESETLFTRVVKAYKHYWPGRLGRYTCYEASAQSPLTIQQTDIYNSVSFGNPRPIVTQGVGVRIEAAIPNVVLYRFLHRTNIFDAGISVSIEHIPDATLYKFSADDLPAHEWVVSTTRTRTVNRSLWLHKNELAYFELQPSAASMFATHASIDGNLKQEFNEIKSWEWLSKSVDIAHYARLFGEIKSAKDILAIQFSTAIHSLMTPIVSCLNEHCKVSHVVYGMGTISFYVQLPHFEAAIAQLHAAGFVVQTNSGNKLPISLSNTPFDTLFELHYNGEHELILSTDYAALVKGSIL